MYRIKYNDSTIFDPYDDDEVVTDAKLTQEVNAAAYMDFTISPKHPLYDTVKERDGVVTLYWMSNDDSEADEKLFEGIIDSISTDFYGYKSISCVSALDYLNDTIVRPYSTVAGEQSLTAPSSIEGYFQWLVDQHNAHVLDSKKRFGVGINQGANLRRSDFIYRSSTNNPTTSEEISNQIIESLGGYLVMRYDGENRLLDLYADVHEMNAQIIDFGVNLLDFTKTIDTADQYTALIPKGGSPTFEDGGFEDDDSVWTVYPYLNISTDQKHGGEKSAYFTEGNGEFINKSFLYVRSGYRYKVTVWVRNERSSSIKVYPRYQVFVGSQWETRTPDGVNPLEVPNDNEWHEFTFDFLPSVSDTTKIRGCWVFDTVTNDNNKRVYVDDFNFVRIQGENELEEDPITVAQMGDGTTPFSYDIVKHGDVIYSMSAVQRYGYREKVFSDDTITDEDALMEEGIRQLNKCMEPTTGIDIKAVDLAMYMKGYTHLQVGQAVRIRSMLHDTDEYLMVTSVDLDLQDPSQTEYELGMAYDSLTGKQSSYLQSLNANINSSLDAVASIDQASKENAIHIGEVESIANDAQNTANNAQNTANNAQNIANSNKEAIDAVKDAQTEYEKQLAEMQQGVADATEEIGQINGRIEGMNSEIESAKSDIEAVRTEAQRNFETAKSAADAAASKADAAQADVDALRSSTTTELQNVKDSVSNVQSDVADALQQASDLAEDLDATKATVEQTVTEFGEVKTTATNAASKADQSLRVSTEASQTATQASQTATSAYEDSQKAITQSSQAVQTANQVSLNLSTNYQTKADADAKYATQASLTATSSQIKAEVSETYATKATVEGLENIANNAVQTWMGSGVPTLSNKPASDWTTTELKAQHSGDIYYDSDTGYSYRFGSSDGKNYSWALIKDTDISKAIADAAAAQETANEAKSDITELNTSIPITYATKTELTQTSDSITSRVEEVAQAGTTTSNKVSQLEQTASGLQSTVKEQSQKLDQQATTISQVSQRVDSVSSTITQVSGRVDGVEDTADEALSQSSQLSQDLSGFKASVQQTYETKQDALSKQSQLQQTINGFRTEVSEEYTTKDEFNALEIGGTNLVIGSKPYGKSGFFKNFNTVSNDEYGEVTLESTTESQSYPNVDISINNAYSFDPRDVVKGEKYVISYDIMMLERTYTNSSVFTESWIGIRNVGGTWSGIVECDGIKNDFLGAPLNEWAHFEHVITSGQADSSTINLSSAIQFGTKSIGKFRFRMRNVKIEKGTKATAWSPAPEDFDGKYTSKTEFAQTTESIKATAQSAATNASSALSKVSSLEVSVDGIDAKVEENASDIADAVKTTSQVSQRVDSLTSTITQVQGDVDSLFDGSYDYALNGGFEDDKTSWDFPNGGSIITEQHHSGLKCYSNSATSQNLNNLAEFTLDVGKTYQWSAWIKASAEIRPTLYPKIICYNGSKWVTNACELSRNETIGTSWKRYVYNLTAPSGYSKGRVGLGVINASGTLYVDDMSLVDITDVKTATDTANSALSQSSTVQQELTSFKTSVAQQYETKTDALNKQSSLQQSVNNLRTEVSEQYTTKSEFNNLSIGGTNLIRGSANGGSDYSAGNGSMQNDGYLGNGAVHANRAWQGYYIRMKNIADRGDVKTGDTVTLSIYVSTSSSSEVTNRFGLYRAKPTDYGQFDAITLKSGRWERLTATFVINDASALGNTTRFECTTDTNYDILWSCPQVEIGNKPTDWSPCPADMLSKDEAETTYSTKSYVDQTSRTVSLGVVEEYKSGKHGSALATQSDITATKNSITQTVSQTYLSKTDATNTYATKTQLTQTSDSLTVSINESIGQVVNNPTAGNLWPNQWFDDDKPLFGSAGTETPPSGGKSRLLQARDHHNSSVRATVYPGHRYRITADAKRTAGSIQLNAGIWYTNQTSGNSWDTYVAPSGSLADLGNGWNRYKWDCTVPSGKQKGTVYFQIKQDASGGSTKWLVANVILEDITAANDAQTTANSAQSTANTANSNAQNAQNRVGNLETCIKMTSSGVRVGKVSNGNFTGYSALVNSAGSFDILDGSGNAITKFTTYGMEIPSNNNGNRDGKFVLTSAGYDLSFVKNGTIYYFRLGSGGIGIHASDGSYVDVGSGGLTIRTNNGNYVNVSPNGTEITSSDGSYIAMSKGSGFTLDSKAFGMLSCGSGGLRFTNDQGWGFALAVNGWSIKWAGNHTLATGDEPGALFIDGRKIQVA